MAYAALDVTHALVPITMIIETGGAQAELWARFWAEENNVPVKTVRDETPVKTAVKVFREKPSYVFAFPFYDLGIVRRARTRGVQVGFAEIRQKVVEQGELSSHQDAPEGYDGGSDSPPPGSE